MKKVLSAIIIIAILAGVAHAVVIKHSEKSVCLNIGRIAVTSMTTTTGLEGAKLYRTSAQTWGPSICDEAVIHVASGAIRYGLNPTPRAATATAVSGLSAAVGDILHIKGALNVKGFHCVAASFFNGTTITPVLNVLYFYNRPLQ